MASTMFFSGMSQSSKSVLLKGQARIAFDHASTDSARTGRGILRPLSFHQDVSQSRRRFRLRLLLDLIGSRVHFVVHAIVNLLLGIIIENAHLLELLREFCD